MIKILIFFLLTAFLAVACQSGSPDGDTSVAVWQVLPDRSYRLAFAGLKMQVSPEDGGKVLSLQLSGKEMLTSPAVHPVAYGSTFWTSPMSWGWPPPAAMDQTPYTARLQADTLWMSGPVIDKTGFQLQKKVFLARQDTAIHFVYTIQNATDSMQRVAPWEVTRVPKGGLAFFDIAPGEVGNFKDFTRIQTAIEDGIYWCAIDADYVGTSQKVSVDALEGWIAYAYDGMLLVKQAEDIPKDQLAPREGDAEIYVDDSSRYVEIEQQGRYTVLPPKESLVYETIWYLTPLPEDVPVKIGSQGLVDKARQYRQDFQQ